MPLPRFANRGLIEARRIPLARKETAGLPRFANRGLIEAFASTSASRPSRSLPRFANRGLIEAGGRFGRAVRGLGHFPDSRIGASLKPDLAAVGWLDSALLPRFANRGLIEASATLALTTDGAHFPDSRIGASLKPVVAIASGPELGHFPDSRIGASLKPERRKYCDDECRTSPIRESGPH